MQEKTDRLLKLADLIKDKTLQKKVKGMIKNPRPKNSGFKQGVKLENAPASEAWHHSEVGGLILHIESVTKMAIAVAKVFSKQYKVKLDMDTLIAGALCHDLMKTSEMEDVGGVVVTKTPMYLDHLTHGIAELYARGFPPKVIHLIASHHGESGPMPPNGTEAVILHFVDTIDAYASTDSPATISATELLKLMSSQAE